MRILFIGGTHPRHLYYANRLNDNFGLAGAILQQREGMTPEPSAGLDLRDAVNWRRHFSDRDRAEEYYFDRQYPPDCDTLTVSARELNWTKSAGFVREKRPDLVLIFGCGMIRGPLMDALPVNAVNMHLGLSPRYRGAATLFWPFYFLEPNWAGVTFHKIVHEPDAGDVLHQCRPPLYRDDGIHDVACKAVMTATDEMLDLLSALSNGAEWRYRPQTATGKNFLARDFRAQHLRIIYDVYNNDITRAYLDGELTPRDPRLYRQEILWHDPRYQA